MKVDLQSQGDVIRAQLEGELGRGTSAEAFLEIRKLVLEKPRDVELDLSRVQHVSSFALATLLRFQEFVVSQDRQFRLLNPSQPVQHILDRTGLQQFFQHMGGEVRQSRVRETVAAPASPAGEGGAPAEGPGLLAEESPVLADRLAEFQAAARERDAAQEELKRLKEGGERFEQELRAARERIDALQKECGQFAEKVTEKDRALAETQGQVREHAARLQAQLEMERRLDTARQDLVMAEQARQEVAKKSAELAWELENLRKELAAFQAERDGIAKEKARLADEKQGLEGKLVGLHQSVEQAEKGRQEMAEKLAQQAWEMETLKKIASEREGDAKVAAERAARFEQELEAARSRSEMFETLVREIAERASKPLAEAARANGGRPTPEGMEGRVSVAPQGPPRVKSEIVTPP